VRRQIRGLCSVPQISLFFLLFFIGIDQLFFVFVSFFGGGGGGEKKEKAAEFIFFVYKLSGWKIRMKYLKSE
jgi:hypothetical protein